MTTTMIRLIEETIELDYVQELIVLTRILDPENQVRQLAMDRRQTEIDKKRIFIERTIRDIANQN